MPSDAGNVTRRDFLGTLAAAPLAASAAGRPGAAEGARPRNVVLILSDDHRYDFMSFLGGPPWLRTPGLDRMAAGGAHLANAFVSTSLCSPSRASILTGLYAHRHGIVDNNSPIPRGTRCFPGDLQKAGYRTVFMGKWHMGKVGDAPQPGFDRWIGLRGQGEYFNPTFNIDGTRVRERGYTTDLLTRHAVKWIEENREQPFFLYLSHKAVHAMFAPAPRHLGLYDKEPIPYPPSMADTEDNYRGKPAWVRAQRNSWHGVDDAYHGSVDFDLFYRRYCETLLALDESVGRVLDALERLGLARSTLVLYMGDNGFCLGEHGLIAKRHMYEESMRVPLLAYGPGLIAPGMRVERLVQNIDLAPTILDAAGVAVGGELDGRSFLPLLRGESVPWRDAVFYEHYWGRSCPQTPTVHGIRTEQYKFMRYHGIWDLDELYDIAADPHEMTNLIERPEHAALARDLRQRVFDWLERTDGMSIPLRRDVGIRADKRGPGR
jgi:N-acetylglucosamine-6-sulfatase